MKTRLTIILVLTIGIVILYISNKQQEQRIRKIEAEFIEAILSDLKQGP